jgi:hypothetical protein
VATTGGRGRLALGRRALSEALALAARIRLEAASPKGFEDMIGLIGALLAPLDAFGQAAAAFSGLHVRVTG